MRLPFLRCAIVALAWLAGEAIAQDCPVIDFEDLADGTAVTNQYAAEGVTFSLTGTGCPAGMAFCRIKSVGNATNSPTRCLGRDQGCPDFFPGNFVMTFSVSHDEVHFSLGNWGGGTYSVRAYNAALGGAVVDSAVIDLVGVADTPVYHTVVMAAAGIRRVEISHSVSGGEVAIDDLGWDPDSTAPTAAFVAPPTEGGCVCNLVPIRGTAMDPDGTAVSWRLERRAVGADTWTLINTGNTPVDNAQFAIWNTAASEGYYTWRLTVTNACGLTSTATYLVYLERNFSTPEIRSPGANAIVGGAVCIDGTVWDLCPSSMATYRVEYAPLPAAAPYNPVDPANVNYTGTVINDPFATWNTVLGGAAAVDGNYRVRVTAVDVCGDTSEATRDVVVDNTAPVALITSPLSCAYVNGLVHIRGTASDTHMGSWQLLYSGDGAHTWNTIAAGNANVVNADMAVWDTTDLTPCSYLLRLIVDDASVANCGPWHNQKEYTVSVDVGCPGDFNRSGGVSVQDIFDFLAAYFALCP